MSRRTGTRDHLDYVRGYYGVPAYVNVRITVNGKQGVIVGGTGPYIKIRLDGERTAGAYHPLDGTMYHVEPRNRCDADTR